MFKKGQSGNPAGKKPGTKDKKWQSIQAMWDLMQKEWEHLTPKERAHYSFEVFKLHFDRAIAQLPKDQNDSVLSANKLMAEMKQLEVEFGRNSAIKSDTDSVADRQAPL